MGQSFHIPTSSGADNNAITDPRTQFDDPNSSYSIDNLQVNNFLNIAEREEAVSRSWDLYHLNIETNSSTSNTFWHDDWNNLATEIRKNERILALLRSQNSGPLDLDESEDYDSDDSLSEDNRIVPWAPVQFPSLRDSDNLTELLFWCIFFFFGIIFAALQHSGKFREGQKNLLMYINMHLLN
uniref:Uncharacterized protein n=1 Tax=Caenorhabditis japonica TaxID=281687 RepID=A0A8R1E832_CAEJA